MQQSFENPESQESKPKSSRLTLWIGAILGAAILLSLWFLFEPLPNRKSVVEDAVAIKMNPVEQDYAKRIEVGNIAVSRAENFLHQEVTILSGELYNGGPERVLNLSLTAEFFDSTNQLVLTQTRNVLAGPQAALAPGEHRSFEISFEQVPNSWNMQSPTVRIARLRLNPQKQ